MRLEHWLTVNHHQVKSSGIRGKKASPGPPDPPVGDMVGVQAELPNLAMIIDGEGVPTRRAKVGTLNALIAIAMPLRGEHQGQDEKHYRTERGSFVRELVAWGDL